jgi:Ca2+:H+ antiporter
MSDDDGPDWQADQGADLLPNEQSQPSRRFSWYLHHATRAALCSSYINVLLVFVPIGVAAGALGWAVVTVFFLNFVAIISLAPLMAFSTRELSASVGRVFGGLLKEILGNAVEMIVRHLCLSVVLYFAFFA